MPDENRKRYLFVAMDRATRWVYLEVRQHQSAQDADVFLRHVHQRAPFKIKTLLTDNGKTFTDRFTSGGEREPSDKHKVDKFCRQHGIDHRLITPYRPQTNGMVERFNGRISDVLNTHRFDSLEDLETTLKRYNWLYNHHINQKALHHRSPIGAMKQWQADRPELFWKRVINHAGPDNPAGAVDPLGLFQSAMGSFSSAYGRQALAHAAPSPSPVQGGQVITGGDYNPGILGSIFPTRMSALSKDANHGRALRYQGATRSDITLPAASAALAAPSAGSALATGANQLSLRAMCSVATVIARGGCGNS